MGTTPDDVIEAFAALVDGAEATADVRPRAELARFQLQGLSGTLAALSGDELPAGVDAALATLRTFVAEHGGPVDAEEGDRLRQKVAAYLVLADDLGLDADRLQLLLERWDAIAAAPAPRQRGARSGPKAGVSTGAANLAACPVCGESFKRVNKHLSAAHPEEWARRQANA